MCRASTPVVRPEWIVDSLKAGRVLPVSLLPHAAASDFSVPGALLGEDCICLGRPTPPLWHIRALSPNSKDDLLLNFAASHPTPKPSFNM